MIRAPRPAATNDGPGLATTHRGTARHDRIEIYQKIKRLAASLVHSPTARSNAMSNAAKNLTRRTPAATIPRAAVSGGDRNLFKIELKARDLNSQLAAAS